MGWDMGGLFTLQSRHQPGIVVVSVVDREDDRWREMEEGGRESTHQSSPSSSPSPLMAQLLWIDHCRFLSVSRPSCSDTSAGVIALG